MPADARLLHASRPLLMLSLCFAAGIALGTTMPVSAAGPALAFVSIFGIAAFLLRERQAATFLVLIAFAAAGAATLGAFRVKEDSPARLRNLYAAGKLASGTPVELEGTLKSSPEAAPDGEFLSVAVERLKHRSQDIVASGTVRVFAPQQRASELRYGSRVRVACELEREERFRDPGVQPFVERLDRQGIDGMCSVKSAMLVEHVADESVFLPLACVHDARSRLIDVFRTELSTQAAGVMIASLVGDKYFLDKETADLFRDGGTFHILVISGLHITFIGGIFLFIVRSVTRRRWLQFGVTSTLVWAYTLAVGADVPVVRAAVMFTTLLFAHAIYRRSELLNSLGLCAVILLAWRPSDLFDASFQLTFASVGAIVGIAYPLLVKLRQIGEWTPTPDTPFPPNVPKKLLSSCETLFWEPARWELARKRNIWTANVPKSPFFGGRLTGAPQRWTRYVVEGLIVSAIVQIVMLPLSVVYFHRVPLGSVVMNLWVGLFIAIESVFAIAGVAVSSLSHTIAAPLFALTEAANWAMLSLPRLSHLASGPSDRIPTYSGAGAAVYFVYVVPIVIAAWAAMRWRPFEIRRHWPQRAVVLSWAIALIGLAAVIVLHPFSAPRADGRLRVDLLDVWQGDSALVTFPNGETMLIDGGGQVDFRRGGSDDEFVPDRQTIGESIVSPVLWDRGYSRIDHVAATHGDADHVEGLADVARNFSIGSAVFGRDPAGDPELSPLLRELARRGVAPRVVSRGERFEIGGAVVEVLHPRASDAAAAGNETSLVLRITYGTRSFLFTGDIERGAEAELAASGADLRADVVKVPHHGSRTSSTQAFVDAVGAKYAIISVGRRSRFGHPHAEVVARWQAAGALPGTTGENGMISFSTDGTDLAVERFAR